MGAPNITIQTNSICTVSPHHPEHKSIVTRSKQVVQANRTQGHMINHRTIEYRARLKITSVTAYLSCPVYGFLRIGLYSCLPLRQTGDREGRNPQFVRRRNFANVCSKKRLANIPKQGTMIYESSYDRAEVY
jgi:hypothetical protein